jgi:hypothetical protein
MARQGQNTRPAPRTYPVTSIKPLQEDSLNGLFCRYWRESQPPARLPPARPTPRPARRHRHGGSIPEINIATTSQDRDKTQDLALALAKRLARRAILNPDGFLVRIRLQPTTEIAGAHFKGSSRKKYGQVLYCVLITAGLVVPGFLFVENAIATTLVRQAFKRQDTDIHFQN